MKSIYPDLPLLERMALAAERVRDRLHRASAALERARVPYAVVGGNAVAAWVATVEEAAVRNTPDVDILIRREDLNSAASALCDSGFERRIVDGTEIFIDGPCAKARDSVHLLMAGEKARPNYLTAAPDIADSEIIGNRRIRVLPLEALVRMELAAFRLDDQVDLRDLLDVGLIDASWTQRFEPELAARLQHLIDTPEQ